MSENNGTKTKRESVFISVSKVIRQGIFPLHSHTSAELYICVGGSAIDHINGKKHLILPGDVYVLDKKISHWQSDMTDFRCYIFQFRHENIVNKLETLGIARNDGFDELFIKDVNFGHTENEAEHLFVDINTMKYAEQVADIIKDEKNADILDMMFMSFVTLVCGRCKRRKTSERWKSYENISKVMYYIEQNYDKPLTLEALAERSHYSPRHFTRLVREHYNTSPMDYLDNVRIKNACNLLLHTSLNIVQISKMCGFEDNNLFSRHFKTAFGVSPTQYRRQNQSPRKNENLP